MDIRQLRAFIQVAEMRSISRAAISLHIAQPALSRQIKQLEEELGEALFDRSERGVSLTPLGEEMLHRAADAVRTFDALRTDISCRSKELAGHVRFGVPKTLMESYVAPALAQFHDIYPAISMLVIEGTTLELREQIRVGALDLAIVSDLDRSPRARMQSLMKEPLVIASSPDSKLLMSQPVSPGFVARHVLVTSNRPNVIRLTLDDTLHREGLTAHVGFETSSHVAIRTLARTGTLFGVLPYSGVVTELEAGRLSAAPIVGATLSWNFIATPLKEHSRQATALRAFMADAAASWVRGRRDWNAIANLNG
jgi:LysR family transcriptional regulator, nitrogen assimilation regulatory protein